MSRYLTCPCGADLPARARSDRHTCSDRCAKRRQRARGFDVYTTTATDAGAAWPFVLRRRAELEAEIAKLERLAAAYRRRALELEEARSVALASAESTEKQALRLRGERWGQQVLPIAKN